ncbi:hypothetical protein CWC09_19025 [Pseudoalteromonas ruthenica]|nr:hypothetical protein CWC09_19025 [Pseudoalteromonas ruthenica]
MLRLILEGKEQGTIAGHNAGRYADVRNGLRRSRIAAVFCDPQIAKVGESYQQVTKRFGDCGCYEIGEVSFEYQRTLPLYVTK